MLNAHRQLERSEASARLGTALNGLLAVTKVGIGIVGHSQALIADGVHSAADVAASVAVVIGLRVARQPADPLHNYGHAKAEAVAQKVVAVLLLLAGFEVGSGAVHSLFRPEVVRPTTLTLVVAAAVMAVKEWMYRIQRSTAVKTGSHALMAQARDNRVDVLSSGLATAGIVGALLGWAPSDALGALAVALLVIWLGVSLFSQAAGDLMDRAAPPELAEGIVRAGRAVDGVLGLSGLRTRMVGTLVLVDLEILVDRNLPLVEAHQIAHRVRDQVMASGPVQDVTVHVSPAPPAPGQSSGMVQ